MTAEIAALPPEGSGPGLIVIGGGDSLLARLGEEGYVVCRSDGDIEAALGVLAAAPRRVGMTGAVGFGAGAAACVDALAQGLVDCAAVYDPPDPVAAVAAATAARPVVVHVAGPDAPLPDWPAAATHAYADNAPGFAVEGDAAWSRPHADFAYSRTLGLLRRVLGPWHDLSSLWEAHVACEFVTKDVDATMATMVPEPYVNHVPTLIGGYGHDLLKRFYRDHFIPQGPKDRRAIPVSRTVGADRVVQEQVLCFTHDEPLDWMLPGVPPTGRYIEIPLVAVVTFRGGKLFNEHIYWDQASVLVQAGLLDPAGLPVAGREQAAKLLDPAHPGNNDMMPGWR
jgi:carboxymethylenebutenolidase